MRNHYTPDSEPLITPEAFYGEQRHICGTCLVIFSREIYGYILSHFECEMEAEMKGCNFDTPIYTFNHEGMKLAFYLSAIGSAIAGHQVTEANWLTGAECFIMSGSAGSLDREATSEKYVIPTCAYRGEGMSDYYVPQSDYIEVPGSETVASVFSAAGVPYVCGPVWTTDSFYRETTQLAKARREEGCLAVEMEVAGVQAVCTHYGFKLYDFLETGDILDEEDYSIGTLESANHDVRKLQLALMIAKQVNGDRRFCLKKGI